LEDARVLARFQEAISSRYPLSHIVPREMKLHLNPAGVQQQIGSLQWVFADEEDVWHLTLAQDALTLETRSYDSFENVLERLKSGLEALKAYLQPTSTRRIGLRYINEIRDFSRPWSDMIRPELLGPLNEPTLARTVQHAVQEVRLQLPDGHFINIRQGLIPSGAAVQPRPGDSVPDVPFYLLDFDAFHEFAQEALEPLEGTEICNHVDAFHTSIYRLFRWSVTEAFIERLAVK
jgi:uncharacterized protein (TIGR04255 family)